VVQINEKLMANIIKNLKIAVANFGSASTKQTQTAHLFLTNQCVNKNQT